LGGCRLKVKGSGESPFTAADDGDDEGVQRGGLTVSRAEITTS
jgi:hypothetical protein